MSNQTQIDASANCTAIRKSNSEGLFAEIHQANKSGVQALVKQGANGNSRNRRGRSALYDAVVSWMSLADNDVIDANISDEAFARWQIVRMALDSATM
jgi:phage terminase Nu1 subunit (DNA packaging protein)